MNQIIKNIPKEKLYVVKGMFGAKAAICTDGNYEFSVLKKGGFFGLCIPMDDSRKEEIAGKIRKVTACGSYHNGYISIGSPIIPINDLNELNTILESFSIKPVDVSNLKIK